jgi:hypothetical protein
VDHAGARGTDLKALNIPSMEEAQIYCNVTGTAVPDLNGTSPTICSACRHHAGYRGPVRDGTAANAKAIESAKRTVPLSPSWEYAQKAGAT